MALETSLLIAFHWPVNTVICISTTQNKFECFNKQICPLGCTENFF